MSRIFSSTRKVVLLLLVSTLCALLWVQPGEYTETFKNALALAMGFYFGQARPARTGSSKDEDNENASKSDKPPDQKELLNDDCGCRKYITDPAKPLIDA